jgi:long-chain fatty acid transport protein
MAGGIVNKQNFSAEYLRTFSRNAATDAADAVAFNPAGVMKMENGTYGNLAIFYAAKDYNNEIAGTDYDSVEPTIIPGLFALYKQDKWAGFFAVTIPAGGGKVDFKDGSARSIAFTGGLFPSSVEAESVQKGFTFGGAYAINDMTAVSAGLRYIDAFSNAKITATGTPLGTVNAEYEDEADGWGGFLGINVTPTEAINIGFRYETSTKLDFERDVKEDIPVPLGGPIYVDGSKERRDLPGLIGLGVSYRINPEFKVDLSYTYYLEKSAKWESTLEDEGNSYDLAISVEYTINPKLKASLGYMLTNTGIDADHMTPEAPELDANTFCGGIAWEVKDNLTLNFALMTTIYDSATRSDGIKLEKSIVGAGIGVQYKFM